ncbi:MAG: sugar phosphate isomerase/epimerase [Clostridia bacterium]|nr:sugar phosphate isomerase/epimerase [Clostridia bacterium]
MKLGAQLYSVRDRVTTPEDLRTTLTELKKQGYVNAQFSGVPLMGAEVWAKISEETGMPIVCTHMPFDRIVNDTDSLIAEHKIFHCSVIGLGGMPNEYRGTLAGLEKFLEIMKEPVKKIRAAGMNFSYHNHWFEFESFSDAEGCAMDVMLERCPDWLFLLDVAWAQFGKHSAAEYIRKIGSSRIVNVHFKDYTNPDTWNSLVPCGGGLVPFEEIIKACFEVGVENALVEQDTAPDTGDSIGQMAKSAEYLLPLLAN